MRYSKDVPKNSAPSPKTCRKCGGCGYLPHFARTDAGRCWSCQGLAQPLTPEILADDELWRQERAAAQQARLDRRAARVAV